MHRLVAIALLLATAPGCTGPEVENLGKSAVIMGLNVLAQKTGGQTSNEAYAKPWEADQRRNR